MGLRGITFPPHFSGRVPLRTFRKVDSIPLGNLQLLCADSIRALSCKQSASRRNEIITNTLVQGVLGDSYRSFLREKFGQTVAFVYDSHVDHSSPELLEPLSLTLWVRPGASGGFPLVSKGESPKMWSILPLEYLFV
jgi:hypothetical protein